MLSATIINLNFKSFILMNSFFFATSILLKGKACALGSPASLVVGFYTVLLSFFNFWVFLLCFTSFCCCASYVRTIPIIFYKERKSNISGDFQEKVILYLLFYILYIYFILYNFIFCFLIRVESNGICLLCVDIE